MSTESPAKIREVPHRWLRRALALFFLLICGGTAYLFGWWNNAPRPESNGGLVVAEKDLDFGEVWEQEAFVWNISLQNPTSQEVKAKFPATCICQKIVPESVVLPPGGEANLQLTLDLRYYPASQEAQAVRPFAVQLAPAVEGLAPEQAGWRIHGRVRVVATAAPRSVDFGPSLVRGQPFPVQTVVLTAYSPATALVAKPNPMLLAAVSRSKNQPKRFELTISPSKESPAGPFTTQLVVQPTDASGKKLPLLSIPVRGHILEEVVAVPQSVALGDRKIGETVAETVVLQSLSGTAFKIIGFKSDSEDVSIAAIGDKEAGETIFRIDQRITRPGKQQSAAQFTVQTSRQQTPLLVSVPLSYIGRALEAKAKSPDSGPPTKGDEFHREGIKIAR